MSSSRRDLEAEFERLAADGYCKSPRDLALRSLRLLTPPEQISITEAAAQGRMIPTADGGARLWSPTLTPYILGPQDALDDPLVRTVVVVGPARSGKTIAAENALLKKLRFGPLTDVLWYLPGESDVSSYADTMFTPFFELHADIRAKIGKKPSDDKRTLKRIGGRFVQLLPANLNSIRMKQAPFIVADEIDGFRKTLRGNFKQQMDIRARAYGATGKAYLCSHPDAGWTDGISPAWREGSRGLWYWPCPHCEGWSSPCPTAEWRTTLDYSRPEGMADDDLLDHVEATACLVCPHCGGAILDAEKAGMLSLGRWIFEGQTIAVDGAVTGEPRPNDTASFWIHGTMSPFVSWPKLAREYVGALVFFEKTRKSDRLRQVTVKSLGEVYEGAGGSARAFDAARLKRRVKDDTEAEWSKPLKVVPSGVLYLTAAVDVGGDKFDVMIVGWGHDGECWIVDRYTLKAGPNGRSLAPGMRQEDWLVIRDQVMKARYPLAADGAMLLPVASTAIDTGGVPGVTWKAREFGRQMKRGICSGSNAYKLRLIKGAASAKAPEIGNGREVNRDDQGRPMEPVVVEYDLGVHKLKELVAERVGVEAPGPGYVHLPADFDPRFIDELTNEALVDGVWTRRGPNETLDLLAYNEAVRQMLKPDRPSIDWINRPPSWATPILRVDRFSPGLDAQDGAAPPMRPATLAERRSNLMERLAS